MFFAAAARGSAKKQRAEFRAAYYADNNPKYNPPPEHALKRPKKT